MESVGGSSDIMTGPQGAGPFGGGFSSSPYKDLLVSQGATNYWPFQTAKNSGETEADQIGLITMIMNGGDVPALANDAGPHWVPNDKGITFAIADTERMRTLSGMDTRQNWSWSGWYRTSSLSGNGPMLFQFSTLTGTSYLFLLHRDDKNGLCVQIGAPPASASFLVPDFIDLADGNWHHIALTRTYSGTAGSDIWTLYLDGSQIGISNASAMGFGPGNTPSSGDFGVAGRTDGDSNVFGGDVAHVAMKINATPWTAAQIFAQWMFHKPTTITGPPVTAGLFAWYDVSDSANVKTASGRINQINDKTGNGRHLVGVGGNRPYTGRTVNGLAVADFQGDQFMRNQSALGFSTAGYTYFVAGLVDDGSSINSGVLAVHNSGATSDWDNGNAFVFNNGTAGEYWAHSQNGVSIQPSGSTVMPPGVYGFRYNGFANAERYRQPHRTAAGTASSGLSSGTANGGILIGARYSTGTIGGSAGSQRLDGTIGEILIYNTILSDAEMDSVYSYLTSKWGVLSNTLPTVTGTKWGYWDPSVASSVHATSGRIDQIDDLSLNGRHLVATGTQRPFTGRTSPSGLDVIDFQAAQILRAISSLATSSYTLFWVMSHDLLVGANMGSWSICPTGANDWDNVNGAVLGWTTNHSDITANGSNAFGFNVTPGTAWVGGYRHNNTGGAGDRIYPGGGTNTRSYGGTAAQGLLLGTRWASGAIGSPFFDGYFAEIILWSTALSNADMDAVGNYLTWKWV